MYNVSDFEYIQSKDNDRVKLFSKLEKSKYRKEHGLFLAEGRKLAVEAVGADCAKYLLVREDVLETEDIQSIIKAAEGKSEVLVLSNAAFGKITTESAPQGIIAVCSFPEKHACGDACISDDKKIIILDGIRDPGNLGTILRSAVAFGIDAVILGDCADIYSPKTVRAAMGAVFKLQLVLCDSLSVFVSKLKKNGRKILGAALGKNSVELGEYSLARNDAVVIGNEGHGISEEVLSVCDSFLKIPMEENCESLNAGIAASVIMWELYKL
ncbi:MAG: RNA methyltransferase [Ruminococcaceae bacterium]|nr:RNA methyltransferase [Oscillospiraceae bacterium]